MNERSEDESDVLASIGMWPIHISANGQHGYTIYANSEQDDDRVLGDGASVWLFPRLDALATSIITGLYPRESPSMDPLAAALRARGDLFDPDDTPAFDLGAGSTVLGSNSQPQRWQISPTVDCINMLWDICRSVGLGPLAARALDPASPLRSLVDEWTFLDPGAEAFISLDFMHEAAKVYDRLLEEVRPRLVTRIR